MGLRALSTFGTDLSCNVGFRGFQGGFKGVTRVLQESFVS